MKNAKRESSNIEGCRLCSSRRSKAIGEERQYDQIYHVVRCLDCGLVYIKETYDAVSPEYIGLKENDLNAHHIWLQTKHKEIAFQQCLDLVCGVLSIPDSSKLEGPLLDVGCGIGGWLAYAIGHTGLSGYGYDSSSRQASYAKRLFPTVRCALTLDDYAAEFHAGLPLFRLITLWDVLEHIRQPVRLIERLAGQITDGGLIFASVPAALPQIVKLRLIPFGWPRARFSWNPREHVAYYSPKTLRHLFENAGLKVLKVGTVLVYPRPLSVFEILRRAAFRTFSRMPNLAPQIYILAGEK